MTCKFLKVSNRQQKIEELWEIELHFSTIPEIITKAKNNFLATFDTKTDEEILKLHKELIDVDSD